MPIQRFLTSQRAADRSGLEHDRERGRHPQVNPSTSAVKRPELGLTFANFNRIREDATTGTSCSFAMDAWLDQTVKEDPVVVYASTAMAAFPSEKLNSLGGDSATSTSNSYTLEAWLNQSGKVDPVVVYAVTADAATVGMAR